MAGDAGSPPDDRLVSHGLTAFTVDPFHHPADPFEEYRRLGQEADHEKRLVREVEEEPGMDEDAVLLDRSSTRSSSLLVDATRSTADHPASPCSSSTDGYAADNARSDS